MTNRQKTKKEVLKELRLISMANMHQKEMHPCEYGHFECTYKEDGPCFNELNSDWYGFTGKKWGG